jgi:hypothetical protein
VVRLINVLRFGTFWALAGGLLIAEDTADWANYGCDSGGSKYSPLNQITPANVGKLIVAWTYHTTDPVGTWEETPIVVNHIMYFASRNHRVIALDGDTGKELWSYDPKTTHPSEHRDFPTGRVVLGNGFTPGPVTIKVHRQNVEIGHSPGLRHPMGVSRLARPSPVQTSLLSAFWYSKVTR